MSSMTASCAVIDVRLNASHRSKVGFVAAATAVDAASAAAGRYTCAVMGRAGRPAQSQVAIRGHGAR